MELKPSWDLISWSSFLHNCHFNVWSFYRRKTGSMLLEYSLKMSTIVLSLKAIVYHLQNQTSPIFLQQFVFQHMWQISMWLFLLKGYFQPSRHFSNLFIFISGSYGLFCTYVTWRGGLLLVILLYFWIKNEICFKSWRQWLSGQTQVGSPISLIDEINHSRL